METQRGKPFLGENGLDAHTTERKGTKQNNERANAVLQRACLGKINVVLIALLKTQLDVFPSTNCVSRVVAGRVFFPSSKVYDLIIIICGHADGFENIKGVTDFVSPFVATEVERCSVVHPEIAKLCVAIWLSRRMASGKSAFLFFHPRHRVTSPLPRERLFLGQSGSSEHANRLFLEAKNWATANQISFPMISTYSTQR